MSYFEQFIIVYIIIFIAEVIWLSVQMRDFKNLPSLYEESIKTKAGKEQYLKVVKKCYSIPKNTFIILAIVPSIVGILFFVALGFDGTATIKIMAVLITVSLILGTLSYIFSKTIFRKILQVIKNNVITKKGRLSIIPAILFQVIPVTLICLLTSYFLISGSELENKSAVYQNHYEKNIQGLFNNNNNISSPKDLIDNLYQINLLDQSDTVYLRDKFNTIYRVNILTREVTLLYEPFLDKNGNNLVNDIYLIAPQDNANNYYNIYKVSGSSVSRLTTHEIRYKNVDASIDGEPINIEDVDHDIYKIDNYAGLSYQNLNNASSVDIYMFIEEDYAFPNRNYNQIKTDIIDSSNDFFFTYALELSPLHNNRIYGYYGNDIHGVLVKVNGNNRIYTILMQYDLSDKNSASSFVYLIVVFILTSIVIYNFARALKTDIKIVSDGIKSLTTGKSEDLNEGLLVTSNDEIGDLVEGFNKVQELTKENIVEIKTNEQTLMEKERLASLGELIGGIAHNMKTPIMSTAGAAEGLTDLITEYRASIDNPSVTSEDHKDIAQDMMNLVTKIKSYNSYMSDIITTVKGQASQLAYSESDTFTLYDMSKRVEILIKHEIKKALLVLNTKILCDPSISINGDINSLIQVINNLISNSIYAYQGRQDEAINLIIDADKDNVIIQVEDHGCGMSSETKSKLFKQMYTTKGKNGTGLGLYMSYSTIRGKFNGTITFKSEEGKGTTFIVTIPRK